MRILATALSALLLALASAGSSRPALAQEESAVQASPVPISAICDVTFGGAASTSGGGTPADPSATTDSTGSTQVGAPADTRFDDAIRACSSVEEWVAVAGAYPDALGGRDPVVFLSARCADPDAGLDAYATCHALGLAIAQAGDATDPVAGDTGSADPRAPSDPGSPSDPGATLPSGSDGGSASTGDGSTGGPAGPATGSEWVALPTMIVKVPSATRVRYFTVVGDTPRALLRQTIRMSRRSCGGKDALACVSLRTKVGQVRPRIDPRTRACTIASVDITLSATVYVPRWTKPARVPAVLVEWWRQELERSALHEEQHIFIQRERIGQLERELTGAPCDAGKAIVKRWDRETDGAHEAFDARELARDPIAWPTLPRKDT